MADEKSPDTPCRQRPWTTKPTILLPREGGFTKAEHWAWARILNGMIADMAQYPGDDVPSYTKGWLNDHVGAKPDPQNLKSFNANHRLSERFLRTLLFHKPWSSAAERPGLRIEHALIEEEIDWSGRQTGELWLDYCRIEKAPVWQRMSINGVLSLRGTVLEKGIEADGLQVLDDLFCQNGFTAKGPVRLVAAKIGGVASFIGAVFEDNFIADGIHVSGDMFCREGFITKSKMGLPGAQIDGDLQLRQSQINGQIDLTGARIDGELHLDGEKHLDKDCKTCPEWGEESALILRNARIGALAGAVDSFRRVRDGPVKRSHFPRLDFTGLRYEDLGGLGASETKTLAYATSVDLIALLEAASEPTKDQFSPGPYRQMANVLADSGQKSKSIELLRAMRKHERKCAKGARKVGLSLSGRLTGFGYRPWYAAGWFMFLTAIWTLIGLAMTSDFDVRFPTPADIAWQIRWFWFTIGNALPLISLDEAHKTFLADTTNVEAHEVPVVIASLFYVHKLLGYSLITYLAASLTGVTDKRS